MRVIGYCRVSSNEQAASGLGLEDQRLAILAKAAELGVEVLAVFEDAGKSGGLEPAKRPGLTAALAALKRGDVLVFLNRGRVSRDMADMAALEKAIARKKATLVSCSGEGTGASEDDLGAFVQRRQTDFVNELYRRQVSVNTKRALAAKRAKGEALGNTPFGFRRGQDGRLERDEREQAVLALIGELRRGGMKLAEVAIELERRGVVGRPAKRGAVPRPLSVPQVCVLAKRALVGAA